MECLRCRQAPKASETGRLCQELPLYVATAHAVSRPGKEKSGYVSMTVDSSYDSPQTR